LIVCHAHHLTFSASTQAVRLCQSYSVVKELGIFHYPVPAPTHHA
jgi:hypothetical protein